MAVKEKTFHTTKQTLAVIVGIGIIATATFATLQTCDYTTKPPGEVIAFKEDPTSAPAEPLIIYNGRYSAVSLSDWELDEIASIVFLEAANQPPDGQQAVAEVILNRVINPNFPDSIHGVIHEGESSGTVQFDTVYALSKATPGVEQYRAVNTALYGVPVLPPEVVFFSTGGENDRVWGKIGDHIFCYEYLWGDADE